jgi:hypothetical protein
LCVCVLIWFCNQVSTGSIGWVWHSSFPFYFWNGLRSTGGISSLKVW